MSSGAAERCFENVTQEYAASAAALNCQERIDALGELIEWAREQRGAEMDLLDQISWWGTSPMGGQD